MTNQWSIVVSVAVLTTMCSGPAAAQTPPRSCDPRNGVPGDEACADDSADQARRTADQLIKTKAKPGATANELQHAVAAAAGAKTQAEDKNAPIMTSSTGGFLRNGPAWNLLGAANLTTLDLGEPSLAFGLERATAYTLLSGGFMKNAASSKTEAARGDEAFGQALLNPMLANFGFWLRGEVRIHPKLRCFRDCKTEDDVHTRTATTLYAEASVARTKFAESSAGVAGRSIDVVPVAFDAGISYRVEGKVPSVVDSASIGSNLMLLAPYAGAAIRAVGGSPSKAALDAVLGSRDAFFLGGELGVQLQLGNLRIDPRVLFLTSTTDNAAVAGLVGVQPYITFSYVLPWSLLSKKTKEEEQKKEHEAEAERHEQDEQSLRKQTDAAKAAAAAAQAQAQAAEKRAAAAADAVQELRNQLEPHERPVPPGAPKKTPTP